VKTLGIAGAAHKVDIIMAGVKKDHRSRLHSAK